MYAVAFLNNGGGSIYWGIRDADKVVIKVKLNYEQRDKLRRSVVDQLAKIQPAVAPTLYSIYLHSVQENNCPVPDCYVVEVKVPRVSSKFLYFTGGNEAYVKTDSGKRKLTVPEIHAEIIRRNCQS